MIYTIALIISTWRIVVVCYLCILELVSLKIDFARCNSARCRCRCIGAYPILKIPGSRPRSSIIVAELYARPCVQRHPLGAVCAGHPFGCIVNADILPVKILPIVPHRKHRIPRVDAAPQDKLHLFKLCNGRCRTILRRHLQRIALRMVCGSCSRLAAVSAIQLAIVVHSRITKRRFCAAQRDGVPCRLAVFRPTAIYVGHASAKVRHILQNDFVPRGIPCSRRISPIQSTPTDIHSIDCQRIMMHVSRIRGRRTNRTTCDRISGERRIIGDISARHICRMCVTKKQLPPPPRTMRTR